MTSTATLIAQILCVGAIIDAAESLLGRRADYEEGGVYSWVLVRTIHRWSTSGVSSFIFDRLFSPRGYQALMLCQIVCAISLFSRMLPSLDGALVFALFTIRVLTHVRHQYGLDGSDQMSVVILGSLTLYYLAPGHLAQGIALNFIAFQSMLAYVASGSAKMTSTIWRSGKALGAILNTQSYGRKAASLFLHRFPLISLLGGWAVMVFQVTFPLSILLSPTSCLIALAMGAMFHIAIAVTMGLNNFVWSFIAAYPALWLASAEFSALNRT